MVIAVEGYNGIFKLKLNGVEYTVWTSVKVVRKYIENELRKRFPDMLIVKELNQIDYSVPEENLPIEIQSTIIHDDNRAGRKPYISYTVWEGDIRKQIDQNIVAYDNCWFFFDSGLFEAMKNSSRNMSINMDWFRKYMKEEKLKVFTVSYDGVVEEKQYKDFDFLSNISQTCSVAAEMDDAILNKNKMKIYVNVVKGYGFTQQEIDRFDHDYKEYSKESKVENVDSKPMISFLIAHTDKRYRLYGNIMLAIGNLPEINTLLCKKLNGKLSRNIFVALGIFDVYHDVTRFVDRFDVCKYIPGYVKNKETWDKLKGFSLNLRQLRNVVTGKSDVLRGIDYYYDDV